MVLRLLVAVGIAAVFPTAALAEQLIILCVQSKNSPGCPSHTTAIMDFDQFNKEFGSVSEEAQKTAMAEKFCKYMVDGKQVLAPHNVSMLSDLTGGSHGTTTWSINCLNPR